MEWCQQMPFWCTSECRYFGATQTTIVDLVHLRIIYQNATKMTIVDLVHPNNLMTARIASGAMIEGTAKGTRQVDRSSHPIRRLVVVASRLWQLRDRPRRVLGQRRDLPDNEEWSGRWESNPRRQRLRSSNT